MTMCFPSVIFQELPRRARMIIYEELFVKPKMINIPKVVRKSKSIANGLRSPSGLSLLRTNRAIHQECLQILYGENRFILEAPGLKPERISRMKNFLTTIGSDGRQCLKYLFLRLHHYRLRGRLGNKARLATVAQLSDCLSLLERSWFDVLEFSLDDRLFADLENAISLLKVNELVIRASPPFIPPLELLKNVWAKRLVVLGANVTGTALATDFGEIPNKSKTYRSVFTNEVLEIDWQCTLPAESNDYFSALPYEIRELIYEHLLLPEHELCPLPRYQQSNGRSHLSIAPKEWGPGKSITVGLLRMSRLLHQECSSLLYGQNVIVLASFEENSITNWLRAIGPKNRTSLRYLRLDHDALLRYCDLDLPVIISPPSMSMFRSSMGSQLGNKIIESFRAPMETVNKCLAEVNQMVAADYTSTLELLRGIPHLSRLELHAPYHYLFSEAEDWEFDGPTMHLEPHRPCPALLKHTIETLPQIHVAVELRLGTETLTVKLAEALESMDLARLVLFSNHIQEDMEPGDYDVRIEDELLKDGSVWHFKSAPGEVIRSFRPFQRNKLEKRIDRFWPEAEELYDTCSWSCAIKGHFDF